MDNAFTGWLMPLHKCAFFIARIAPKWNPRDRSHGILVFPDSFKLHADYELDAIPQIQFDV